jgi:hypothetical protein
VCRAADLVAGALQVMGFLPPSPAMPNIAPVMGSAMDTVRPARTLASDSKADGTAAAPSPSAVAHAVPPYPTDLAAAPLSFEFGVWHFVADKQAAGRLRAPPAMTPVTGSGPTATVPPYIPPASPVLSTKPPSEWSFDDMAAGSRAAEADGGESVDVLRYSHAKETTIYSQKLPIKKPVLIFEFEKQQTNKRT